MSEIIDRAKAALNELGAKSGLEAIERYREWLRVGGPKDLLAEAIATQRLLDDLTASDIGEVTAHRDELWTERNALLQKNAALHAEVARLGGGVR
jgi:hypothetical protein